MSMGSTAVIGRAETIEHVLADRRRLKSALADTTTTPEKRAEVEARLAEVEGQLTAIRSAIDEPEPA